MTLDVVAAHHNGEVWQDSLLVKQWFNFLSQA